MKQGRDRKEKRETQMRHEFCIPGGLLTPFDVSIGGRCISLGLRRFIRVAVSRGSWPPSPCTLHPNFVLGFGGVSDIRALTIRESYDLGFMFGGAGGGVPYFRKPPFDPLPSVA